MASIQLRLTSCLNSVIQSFRENPFDFLYEIELQATLYSDLKKTITETIEAPVVIHRNKIGKEWVPINLIRMEYPGVTKTGGLFDIAVIHPDSKRKASMEENYENDAFWNQNLLGVVEIKYCLIGYNLNRTLKSFWQDIKKLKEYHNPEKEFTIQFRLALLFIQLFDESMHSIISRYLERNELKCRIVTGINEVCGIEAYIISQPTIFKIEGLNWRKILAITSNFKNCFRLKNLGSDLKIGVPSEG